MKTVSAQPAYLIYPAHRVECRAAVAELYRRTPAPPDHQALALETMAAIDDPEVTRWGETHFVTEFTNAPDRYPRRAGMVLVVYFDRELVASERVYLTNRDATAKLGALFGPDFASFPGVDALQQPG